MEPIPVSSLLLDVEEENYAATFRYPDGTIIMVLIPNVEALSDRAQTKWYRRVMTNPIFGLNCITGGHYSH